MRMTRGRLGRDRGPGGAQVHVAGLEVAEVPGPRERRPVRGVDDDRERPPVAPGGLGLGLDVLGDALDLLRGLRGDEQLARVGAVQRVDVEAGEDHVGRARRRGGEPELSAEPVARVPDRLEAEARQQDQRQQRVHHQPGELLARPRVDGQREHERPDQEHAQRRRAPEREHGPDRPEQEHGPLHAEEHDDVEAPRLAAAPDVLLAEPVAQAVVDAVPEPRRVREERGEEDREDGGERRERPRPRFPADARDRPQQLRALLRDRQPAEEERAGHEYGDERRLLGGEGEREQPADQRRLMAARAVEEAEYHHQQRERDARDVDVLTGEAAEVQVRRPDGEQRAGRERGDAAEHAAQQPAERDHPGAHQRRRQARREVRVAEQHVHQRGQVEAERAVQERHVVVVAGAEDPGEVGVLALVVVERAVAEVDQAQRQRERDQRDPREDLPAGAARALRSCGGRRRRRGDPAALTRGPPCARPAAGRGRRSGRRAARSRAA